MRLGGFTEHRSPSALVNGAQVDEKDEVDTQKTSRNSGILWLKVVEAEGMSTTLG